MMSTGTMSITERVAMPPHSRRMRIVTPVRYPWVLLMLTLSLHACTTKPANPSGWTAVESTVGGFKISLPASWKWISMNPAQTDSTINAITRDPAERSGMTKFALDRRDHHVNFLAVDPPLKATLQLTILLNEEGLSLDSLARMLRPAMEQHGLSGAYKEVEINSAEAQEVIDSTSASYTLQVLVKGSLHRVYLLTLGTEGSEIDHYGPMIRAISRKFEVVTQR